MPQNRDCIRTVLRRPFSRPTRFGDRADSRDAHQALSDLVLSELTCELLGNLTDLFLKVLEVLVEAFENRN